MPMTSNPSNGVLALILFGLFASGAARAAEPQMASEQPRAPDASATSIQVEAVTPDPATMRPEPPSSTEQASRSPLRPKPERPNLGLCDGS